jgi:hypothetical protein
MPKSEFDDVLHVAGGRLFASGPFLPEGAAGDDRPTIVWRVQQASRVAHGACIPTERTWNQGDQVQQTSKWEAGPARASAVVVTLGPDGAETFPWEQDVTLKIG